MTTIGWCASPISCGRNPKVSFMSPRAMDFLFRRRGPSKTARGLSRRSNCREPTLPWGLAKRIDLLHLNRPAASDFSKPHFDEEEHGSRISSTSAERNQSDRRLCRRHTGQTQQGRTGGPFEDQPVPQLAAYCG